VIELAAISLTSPSSSGFLLTFTCRPTPASRPGFEREAPAETARSLAKKFRQDYTGGKKQ